MCTHVRVLASSSECPANGGWIRVVQIYNFGVILGRESSLLEGKRKEKWRAAHAHPGIASFSRWLSFGELWWLTSLLKGKFQHMHWYRINAHISIWAYQHDISSLYIIRVWALIYLCCWQWRGSRVVHPIRAPNVPQSCASTGATLGHKSCPRALTVQPVPSPVPLRAQVRE